MKISQKLCVYQDTIILSIKRVYLTVFSFKMAKLGAGLLGREHGIKRDLEKMVI
ncbi:MAG: hypothetical protein N2169_07200 [bacterium]|nr:hypothetical protein [bacterium]